VAWLEAMACGKPIIAYDIGWAKEVIHSGVDGLLIKPAGIKEFLSAIKSILLNKSQRQALGKAAREKVVNLFSNTNIAKQSAEWYQQVYDEWSGINK